jgi:hypothetical protein
VHTLIFMYAPFRDPLQGNLQGNGLPFSLWPVYNCGLFPAGMQL